jgi:hypothetical protein
MNLQENETEKINFRLPKKLVSKFTLYINPHVCNEQINNTLSKI